MQSTWVRCNCCNRVCWVREPPESSAVMRFIRTVWLQDSYHPSPRGSLMLRHTHNQLFGAFATVLRSMTQSPFMATKGLVSWRDKARMSLLVGSEIPLMLRPQSHQCHWPTGFAASTTVKCTHWKNDIFPLINNNSTAMRFSWCSENLDSPLSVYPASTFSLNACPPIQVSWPVVFALAIISSAERLWPGATLTLG